MNPPESLNTEPKKFFNLITQYWENLDDAKKILLTKIWKVLTYNGNYKLYSICPF